MDFEVSESIKKAVDLIGLVGQTCLRPLGLEADRLKRPIPKDHEFYYFVAKSGIWLKALGRKIAGKLKASENPRSGMF